MNTKIHALKILPSFFQDVFAGRKMFEIRRYDRDFGIGDYVTLKEWDDQVEMFTGREVSRRIIYMTDYMQAPGYIVLGLASEELL